MLEHLDVALHGWVVDIADGAPEGDRVGFVLQHERGDPPNAVRLQLCFADQLLHPDWRASQADAVRQVCTADDTKVWIAENDGQVVGFVALSTFDADRKIGEIAMLAVEPDQQRRGIGRALTEHGLSELRAAGMVVAMVETGGDPGHEPARLTYQSAGFTNLPISRYFKAL